MVRRFIFACLFWALAAPCTRPAGPPAPAIVLPCEVVGNHDGDTLDVDVTVRVRVRLLDCWAPELTEPGGNASKDSLRLLIARPGGMVPMGTLHVPLKSNRLADVFTFGRVLGYVWIDGESKSLNEQQVDGAMASTKKGGKLGE